MVYVAGSSNLFVVVSLRRIAMYVSGVILDFDGVSQYLITLRRVGKGCRSFFKIVFIPTKMYKKRRIHADLLRRLHKRLTVGTLLSLRIQVVSWVFLVTVGNAS